MPPARTYYYVGGAGGVVWWRDSTMSTGSAWIALPAITTGRQVRGVFAFAPNDVYATQGTNLASETPELWHWDGTAWAQESLPGLTNAINQSLSVQGLADGSVIAVTHRPTTTQIQIHHKEAGGSWVTDLGYTTNATAYWWHATAINNILFVGAYFGSSGGLWRWNGSSLTQESVPGTSGLPKYHFAAIAYADGVYYLTQQQTAGAADTVYEGTFGSWTLKRTLSSGSGLTRSYETSSASHGRCKCVYDEASDQIVWALEEVSTGDDYIVRYNVTADTWEESSTTTAREPDGGFWAYDGRYVQGEGNGAFSQDSGATWYTPSGPSGCYAGHILSSTPEAATTADEEQGKEYNRAFWGLHISGFPQMWFTRVPVDWDVPDGWSYNSGLMMLPGQGVEFRHSIDPLGGIADAESIQVNLAGDEITALLRSQRRYADSSPLGSATNDILAGDDPATIDLEHSVSGFDASDGTVYLGNQTITYASYAGTTITTPDRGRYAILDDDLAEVKWKPRIEWDASLSVAPIVSKYPQRLIGRVVTIYRGYYDPITGLALGKDQAQIRFRGTITTFGDAGDGIGVELNATSLLELLNSEAFADLPEYQLFGYGILKGASNTTHTLILYESSVTPDGAVATALEVDVLNKIPKRIQVDLQGVATPKDLEKVVQKALDDAQQTNPSFPTKPYLACPWKIGLVDGRYEIGADVRGMGSGGTRIAQGASTALVEVKMATGIGMPPGDDLILRLLGFDADGGIDLQWSHSGYGFFDWELCKHSFEMWTNPGAYGYIKTPDPGYQRVQMVTRAKNPPAKAGWHSSESNILPVLVPSGAKSFQDSPGDQWGAKGGALILVDDAIVYQAIELQLGTLPGYSDSGEFHLLDTIGAVNHPIGSYAPHEHEMILVSDNDDDDKYCRQAWIPTCRQKVTMTIGGSDYTEIREGVQYFLLQTMLSTGSGDQYNSDFDILDGGWGLEIPEHYIDLDSFEQLGDLAPQSALLRKYIFRGPFDFAQVLETEAKTVGFQVVMRGGKITARPATSATHAQVSYDIGPANRVDDSGVTWQVSPEGLINKITLRSDYDVVDDRFVQEDHYYNLASAVDAQRIESEEIDNKGIGGEIWRGISSAVSAVKQAMQDRLWRLSRESYIYECDITRALDMAAIGDVVTVSDARIINPYTGTRGIDRHLGLIEEISFDDMEGRGTVLVRVRYDYDESYVPTYATTHPPVNTSNYAPAIQTGPAGSVNGQSVIPYVETYSEIPTFVVGAQIVVTDLETGSSHSATVVSQDASAKTITISSAVPALTITTEGIITLQDFASNLATGTKDELGFSFVASASGILNATQNGYKIVL